MRVQIPAYTDMWMKGARYGQVVGIRMQRVNEMGTKYPGDPQLLYRVELDAFPKMRPLCYIAADCTEV